MVSYYILIVYLKVYYKQIVSNFRNQCLRRYVAENDRLNGTYNETASQMGQQRGDTMFPWQHHTACSSVK